MDKDLKISIGIPTWEQYDLGHIFLTELLDTVSKQNYKNFNVVISDHSLNEDVKNVVSKFSTEFEIKYFKFEEKRGNSPANTNNVIKNCDGDVIKIMFQDDLLVNENTLLLINQRFKEGVEWVVNGSNHTYDGKKFVNPMFPRWNDKIWSGVNTISSPSVLSFKNHKEEYLLFDEELVMLMDCDFYYQLYKKFGLPSIINEILISNRVHNKQISSLYNKNINEEITYIKNKFNL